MIKVGKEDGNNFRQDIDYNIQQGDEWTDGFWDLLFSNDDKTWGIKAINAPSAWEYMDSIKDEIEPVKVGLIDSGFYSDHEDLGFADDGIFYDNHRNDNKDKGIETVSEDSSHGTHVAGIMAAKGNNKEGICGIYPYGDGRLYGASYQQASKYKENISLIVDKCCLAELIFRNVKVINCSYTWTPDNYAIRYDDDAWIKFVNDYGCSIAEFLKRAINNNYDFVIVVAAGNDSDVITTTLSQKDGEIIKNKNKVSYDPNGKEVVITKEFWRYYYEENERKYMVSGITDERSQTFCANRNLPDGHIDAVFNNFFTSIGTDYKDVYDRIIVVGAIDKNGEVADYSNAGNRVDIFAPGTKVYSTIPDNKYDYMPGTSMAAPHIAGVCADVWSINNSLDGSQVKELVCSATIPDKIVYTSPDDTDKRIVDVYKAVTTAYIRKSSHNDRKEPELGALLGWVVDSANEDIHISEAEVTSVNIVTQEEYSVTTDDSGHFELFLPDGDYTLRVTAREYETDDNIEAHVSGGEVTYLENWIKMKRILADVPDDKAYTWQLEPSIEAEDIIVLDESYVPNSETNARGEHIADRSFYAIVQRNGKYAFIDYNGNELSDFYNKYWTCGCGALDLYNDYSEGVYYLNDQLSLSYNEWGCQHGMLSDYVYYDISTGMFDDDSDYYLSTSDNIDTIAATSEDPSMAKYALIHNSELSTNFIFEDAKKVTYNSRNTGNTLVACKQNGKWGYYRYDGSEVISCQFDDGEVYVPSDGYIAVCRDGDWGYYNINGNEVISCGEFEQARPVYDGKAWVKKDGKRGVILIDEEGSGSAQNINNVSTGQTEAMNEAYNNYKRSYLQNGVQQEGDVLFYALKDLNDDGIPELFLGEMNKSVFADKGNVIAGHYERLDIYTYQNGKCVLLFSDEEINPNKTYFWITENNDICCCAGSGTGFAEYTFFKLNPSGQIDIMQDIWHSSDVTDDTKIRYYYLKSPEQAEYQKDGWVRKDWSASDIREEITEQEYNSRIDSYIPIRLDEEELK